MTDKKTAWKWCSKYIRLRDAIAYQEANPTVPFGYLQCCTCNRIIVYDKNCDAGHFIPKGSRGSSGVQWDERNIHGQCKNCNGGFRKGMNIRHEVDLAYEQYMLDKYGEEVVDELKVLDRIQSYHGKIIGIGLMYKSMYNELRSK
ncbi:hypothetical protein LCGC14_1066710 [marine sediment metagenome]|uniref:Uncharacterized protein n=1 Tax=marine sediment metagenome TaxID=412755 RepID=A0A0F9MJD9_9ZZZZ